MNRSHFILLGRVSKPIANALLTEFSESEDRDITKPGNIIQSRFGTFGDGESIFELFVDGDFADHPLKQELSEAEKKHIIQQLNGAHVTIIHSMSGENTTSRANSLLDGIYDLKNIYGVKSVTVIAPHLPFMRNDRRFTNVIRNPNGTFGNDPQYNAVAGRHFARRLRQEGADRVVGFEAHSLDAARHYREYFGHDNFLYSGNNAVKFINMGDFFADTMRKKFDVVDLSGDWKVACGPPDGLNKANDYGIARAKRFGLTLYANTVYSSFNQSDGVRDIPWMYGIHKERINERETVVREFAGEVAGKICFIVDDIASSGGTIIRAAQCLRDHYAKSVIALATHGTLVNGALDRLMGTDLIDEVRLTDTVPSAYEKAYNGGYLETGKIIVQTIAPLIIREVLEDQRLSQSAKWAYPIKTAQSLYVP